MRFINKYTVTLTLLAGLIFAGWWGEKKQSSKKDKEEKEAQILSSKVADFSKIELTGSRGKIVFQKRPKDDKGHYTDEFAYLSNELSLSSDWMMVAPRRALLDYSNWTSFQTNLEELKSTKTIADSQERAGDYGLTSPDCKIALYKAKDSETPDFELILGEPNTADTGVYASSSTDKRIVLVEKKLQFAQDKSVFDWTETRVIGFKDINKLKELELFENGKSKWILARNAKESNVWQIVNPEQMPASESTVDTYINILDAMKAKDVFDQKASELKEALGLDKPLVKLRALVEENGQDVTKELFLGSKGAKKDSAWLARSASNDVYQVRGSLLNEVSKDYKYFASKKPFQFSADKVTKLSVTLAQDAPKIYQKSGEEWKDVSKPDGSTFDGFFKISSMEAKEYLGKTKPKEIKTGKTRLQITWFDDKNQSENLVIYQDTITREGILYAVGKVDPSGSYYLFTVSDIESIENAIRSGSGSSAKTDHDENAAHSHSTSDSIVEDKLE